MTSSQGLVIQGYGDVMKTRTPNLALRLKASKALNTCIHKRSEHLKTQTQNIRTLGQWSFYSDHNNVCVKSNTWPHQTIITEVSLHLELLNVSQSQTPEIKVWSERQEIATPISCHDTKVSSLQTQKHAIKIFVVLC